MTLIAAMFSISQIVMTLAALLSVPVMAWHLTTSCQTRKRNVITSALLIVVVTTIGIGIYPVVFQKNRPSTQAEDGDMEKTGATVFICKITPMRNENGEDMPVHPCQVGHVITTLHNCFLCQKLKHFELKPLDDGNIYVEIPADESSHLAQVRQCAQVASPPLTILEERTASAEMAVRSAQHL